MRIGMPKAVTLGQAGLYRVSSELHLRLCPAYSPTVDIGVDLLTAYWQRVQVKTSKLMSFGGCSMYQFRQHNCGSLERSDFFVFWGRDEDRFWIVPEALVTTRQSLYAPPKTNSRTCRNHWILDCENRWDYLVPKPDDLKAPKNLCLGVAGVHRVASELLLRDLPIYAPFVDIGTDILTHQGVRIQVKSAHKSFRQYKEEGAYYFYPTLRTEFREGKLISSKNRNVSTESDFIVLWGIDENRFWIMPSKLLDGKDLITLGPKSAFVDADVSEIKRLRTAGMSHESIAKELGLTTGTVWKRDKVGIPESGRVRDSWEIRSYESRWDLLIPELALESVEAATEEVAVDREAFLRP